MRALCRLSARQRARAAARCLRDVVVAGRAGEVAEALQALLVREDLWRDSFAPTLTALSVVWVRLERAEAALEQLEAEIERDGGGSLAAYLETTKKTGLHFRLRQDARGWANTLRGYLNDLGLSPAALARISRDSGLGRAARASAALRALEEHVTREYGGGEVREVDE